MFRIRSMMKPSVRLTCMINSRACTSGQSHLFIKWTDKGPSWLWYCETQRKREHNIEIPDQKHKPVISLWYAMLSDSATYKDGEMHHMVNTELHYQFKYLSIKGTAVSPIFCVDSRSMQRPPSPGRWPLSALLKAIPLPEIKPPAQWQTFGSTDTRPGSKKKCKGKQGWSERRNGKWGKKKKWDSKGAGGGLGGRGVVR